MADGLLALIVQRQSNISQSTTGSYDSCVCFLVHSHAIEATHIDNQMSVLSSKTMCSVAVASALGSDFNTTRDPARYSILNMLNRLWYGVRSRYER